jgi:xanthine dehydrogenase small subunit
MKTAASNIIRFILNEKEITTHLPPGTVVLDLVRYHQQLTGTKIGCREGDCGACTILVGEIINGDLHYRSMTSCLMPIGNAHGKHIVTIEGINHPDTLNPVQQALSDEGATQCGFCTPGFVMSLAGFCLGEKPPTKENVIAAIDGNICRCTGYKSIERAALRVAAIMKERPFDSAQGREDPAQFTSKHKILPAYFSGIKTRLQTILNGELVSPGSPAVVVAGGTDLYVQKHEEMTHADIRFVFDNSHNWVKQNGNKCSIGPAATVTDLKNSALISKIFPSFQRYAKLVSSTPIRNMATIAGNFVNASPIGDFTIFFLALDANITLEKDGQARTIPLRHFYKGYKQLDKQPGEIISEISFDIPPVGSLFNFEKVSKRTHLDIASVNTAVLLTMKHNVIEKARISAGGVGPIPLYLQKASAFLEGKTVSEELIQQAVEIAYTEISPISDARGTKEYKRLLLGQLIKAHFLVLFPNLEINKLLILS